jgi:hypothetical protein
MSFLQEIVDILIYFNTICQKKKAAHSQIVEPFTSKTNLSSSNIVEHLTLPDYEDPKKTNKINVEKYNSNGFLIEPKYIQLLLKNFLEHTGMIPSDNYDPTNHSYATSYVNHRKVINSKISYYVVKQMNNIRKSYISPTLFKDTPLKNFIFSDKIEQLLSEIDSKNWSLEKFSEPDKMKNSTLPNIQGIETNKILFKPNKKSTDIMIKEYLDKHYFLDINKEPPNLIEENQLNLISDVVSIYINHIVSTDLKTDSFIQQNTYSGKKGFVPNTSIINDIIYKYLQEHQYTTDYYYRVHNNRSLSPNVREYLDKFIIQYLSDDEDTQNKIQNYFSTLVDNRLGCYIKPEGDDKKDCVINCSSGYVNQDAICVEESAVEEQDGSGGEADDGSGGAADGKVVPGGVETWENILEYDTKLPDNIQNYENYIVDPIDLVNVMNKDNFVIRAHQYAYNAYKKANENIDEIEELWTRIKSNYAQYKNAVSANAAAAYSHQYKSNIQKIHWLISTYNEDNSNKKDIKGKKENAVILYYIYEMVYYWKIIYKMINYHSVTTMDSKRSDIEKFIKKSLVLVKSDHIDLITEHMFTDATVENIDIKMDKYAQKLIDGKNKIFIEDNNLSTHTEIFSNYTNKN